MQSRYQSITEFVIQSLSSLSKYEQIIIKEKNIVKKWINIAIAIDN